MHAQQIVENDFLNSTTIRLEGGPKHRWYLLDPEILVWVCTGCPDPHSIRDLFELRGILEPVMAPLDDLSCKNALLIGLKSGLYGGRKRSVDPVIRNPATSAVVLRWACGKPISRRSLLAHHPCRRACSCDRSRDA